MLLQPIVQIAYFVSDARVAAQRMAATAGAGPFYLAERIELAWARHRDEPSGFLHTSAYGQWGHLMMELVQQDNEGPSPFRDMYAPGEEGIHHVAMMVESLDVACAAYADAGFDIATRAMTTSGVEFVFVDTVAALGHMVEMYESTSMLRDFYGFVEDAAQDWDGDVPVRALT